MTPPRPADGTVTLLASPVDTAVLDELREQIDDTDGSRVGQLIAGYLADASTSRAELSAAVAVADLSRVRSVVHGPPGRAGKER